MKTIKKLEKQAFGVDEFGFSQIPVKFSNIKISRIHFTHERGGCPFCFPHGMETNNSTELNVQRNWKKQRKRQYKN